MRIVNRQLRGLVHAVAVDAWVIWWHQIRFKLFLGHCACVVFIIQGALVVKKNPPLYLHT